MTAQDCLDVHAHPYLAKTFFCCSEPQGFSFGICQALGSHDTGIFTMSLTFTHVSDGHFWNGSYLKKRLRLKVEVKETIYKAFKHAKRRPCQNY